jgi:two-component system NtrC family sensor kinase
MKPSLGLLLLSLMLLTLPAPAQTRQADSLRQLLRAQPAPTPARVHRLLALVQVLKTTDAPQATVLSHQALDLARQLNDAGGEGEALLDLSILYRRQVDYAQARRYAQLAGRHFLRHRDNKGLGRAWLQLSQIDLLQGNPVPALAAALKALPLAESTRDVRTKTHLLATMGNIYYEMGNYDEAVTLHQASLKSALGLREPQLVLLAINGLGNSYQMLKNWPQALRYHQRALQLSQQLGDQQGEAADETNLAEVYGLQGNQAEALAHGQRARQLVQATHDDYTLPSVELALARAYLLAGQTDSALGLAHQSLRRSQQTHSAETIRNASDILAQAYAKRRNFAPAYHYRNLQMAYDDTLSGEATKRRISRLRYGYELDKKQAQIELLTKNRQLQAQAAARQRQQLYGLLTGLGCVVLMVALLLRNLVLRQRANRHLKEKNTEIATHRDRLDRTLTELQTTQTQLVQREKMASLGELTAGVAHEIQNPLNFITNFSDLSVDLVTELEEELAKEALSTGGRQTINELLADLNRNQAKIHQHGHRADRIVKSMLEHSRTRTGQPQLTDLNALADEYLHLAYHGWRAKNKNFNAQLTTEFDPNLPPCLVVPQDLSRALLNLLTNAFYAVTEKSQQAGPNYCPEVAVHTQCTATGACIKVRDNGNGIPADIHPKIFQPFFTTKPTGEGTGLGLSLSYDIITKGHGGSLSVESQEGKFTEFTIYLPCSTQHEVLANSNMEAAN